MSDQIEFTPQEKISINIGKDSGRIFSLCLIQTLSYVIPSVGLVIFAIVSQQHGYGLIGYGILLIQEGRRLILVKRGLQTKQRIIEKYETKLQSMSAKSEQVDAPSSSAKNME